MFNNEKPKNHLCKYFYDRKFKKKYSDLIDLVILNWDYESYNKMEELKEYYIKIKRFDEN